MKKEKLKRLKAGLLAATLCFTLGACKKEEEKKEETNEAIVFFVEGKALIYESGYHIYIGEGYSSIGNSAYLRNKITMFSAGVEAIITKNLEDAYELAQAIVGEENIIYIDYKDEDMQLTREKTK